MQMLAAFTVLIDKIVENLNDIDLGEQTKTAIQIYFTFREHYLVLTFLVMITVYMISAITMIWLGKRKLMNFYLKSFYGVKNETTEVLEDDDSDFKGIKMVSLPRA